MNVVSSNHYFIVAIRYTHFKCFVNRGAIRIRINLHFIYFHFTRIFSFPFHASISFFRFVGNDRRWIFTGSFFFLTSLLLSVHRFLANLPDFASFTITGWNNFNFIFFFFFFFQRTNRPVYQSLGSRRAGDKWRRGRVVLKKKKKKKREKIRLFIGPYRKLNGIKRSVRIVCNRSSETGDRNFANGQQFN